MTKEDYYRQGRAAGVEAVHRAQLLLSEHWDTVDISVTKTDERGNVATYELECGEDDEDGEKT